MDPQRRNRHARDKVTPFLCLTCGQSSPQEGPCPFCRSWERIEDATQPLPILPPLFKEEDSPTRRLLPSGRPFRPATTLPTVKFSTSTLSQGKRQQLDRLQTGIAEWDRVVGGGTVRGSTLLLAASPGCGKSTLTLQILDALAKRGHRTLLLSGEEMIQAVSERAERLGCDLDRIEVSEDTELHSIESIIHENRPAIVVIDSLQKVTSPSQPRLQTFVAKSLCQLARKTGCSMILISHVNKEDDAAGEQAIQHEVDAICSLDQDHKSGIRYLSASKNRYGSTEEVGLFSMTAQGLMPLNTDSLLLSTESRVGSVPAVVRVGRRYLLLSVEALLDTSEPDKKKQKLVATGIEIARLKVILGVLAQVVGERIEDRGDLYLQVGFGGPYDPSTDAAVAMAILSAYYAHPLPFSNVWGGEIRLTGQVHPPTDLENRQMAVRGRLGSEAAYHAPRDTHAALAAFPR